jgi:hypothetical protein
MNIQDYENYVIYPDGDIYSKKTNIYIKPRSPDEDGYRRIDLSKNGKSKRFRVHRLVALHYIPKPENKNCIDHIDGNKLNNNVSNLRWVTHAENMNAFKNKYSNNTSGFKNICPYNNSWRYRKQKFGNKIVKYFDTKEEAIAFKKEYELLNPQF